MQVAVKNAAKETAAKEAAATKADATQRLRQHKVVATRDLVIKAGAIKVVVIKAAIQVEIAIVHQMQVVMMWVMRL